MMMELELKSSNKMLKSIRDLYTPFTTPQGNKDVTHSRSIARAIIPIKI